MWGKKRAGIYSLSAKLPLDEMINLEGIEGEISCV